MQDADAGWDGRSVISAILGPQFKEQRAEGFLPPGAMAEEHLHFPRQGAVQQHQRQAHRADPLALPALHTPARQMEGPAQVEHVLLRDFNPGIHPQAVVPLKHAGGAIALRADLAAGVTADAAVKLGKPEGHALRRRHWP